MPRRKKLSRKKPATALTPALINYLLIGEVPHYASEDAGIILGLFYFDEDKGRQFFLEHKGELLRIAKDRGIQEKDIFGKRFEEAENV